MRAIEPLYILSLVRSEHAASGGGRARRPPPDAPWLRYTLRLHSDRVGQVKANSLSYERFKVSCVAARAGKHDVLRDTEHVGLAGPPVGLFAGDCFGALPTSEVFK